MVRRSPILETGFTQKVQAVHGTHYLQAVVGVVANDNRVATPRLSNYVAAVSRHKATKEATPFVAERDRQKPVRCREGSRGGASESKGIAHGASPLFVVVVDGADRQRRAAIRTDEGHRRNLGNARLPPTGFQGPVDRGARERERQVRHGLRRPHPAPQPAARAVEPLQRRRSREKVPAAEAAQPPRWHTRHRNRRFSSSVPTTNQFVQSIPSCSS